MTTAAAIDRVVHHSVILELTGPSYRVDMALDQRQVPIGDRDVHQEAAPIVASSDGEK